MWTPQAKVGNVTVTCHGLAASLMEAADIEQPGKTTVRITGDHVTEDMSIGKLEIEPLVMDEWPFEAHSDLIQTLGKAVAEVMDRNFNKQDQ